MSSNHATETLTGLLSYYSPSGQEQAAVNFLVDHMRRLGYTQAYIDEAGNAVGILGKGPQQIMLLGHIDTVRGDIPLRIDGDLLYGRGSVDAKGPLAAFVEAAIVAGEREGWQFIIIGAVGEEQESVGARFIVNRYQPDYAIIGEPSHWDRLTIAYKGSAWAQINTHRPVAHTAAGQESACEAIFSVWQKIQTWTEGYNQGCKQAFDRILLTMNAFSSDSNGFEEWAGAQVGARLPPALPPDLWYDQLTQIIQPLQAKLKPLGFPMPAYRCQKNTALVRAFLAAIRAAGGKPGFTSKTGSSDLNIVAPLWNCPTIAYGPGDSTLDHTPNEHISLAEYGRGVRVLQTVLERLAT